MNKQMDRDLLTKEQALNLIKKLRRNEKIKNEN